MGNENSTQHLNYTGEGWEAGGGFLGALSRGLNAIPVVGHIKAGVHLICSDADGAGEAFKTSTECAIKAAVAFAEPSSPDLMLDAKYRMS